MSTARIAAIEALGRRFEGGDQTAALEAIAQLGMRGEPDGGLSPPRYPDWLDRAVKTAMFAAVCSDSDSLLAAFGVPTGKGRQTLAELLARRFLEDAIYAAVLAIQDGSRQASLHYPRGVTSYTIAADLFSELRLSPKNVEALCAKSKARGAPITWRPRAQTIYTALLHRILTTRKLPPGRP